MIDYDKLTDIYCLIHEFCGEFDKTTKSFILGKPSKKTPVMSKSEVICILLIFHLSGFRPMSSPIQFPTIGSLN